MNQREAFEAWAKNPPMEFCLARHADADAWPGNYKDYHVECAWQAWKAAIMENELINAKFDSDGLPTEQKP